MTSDGSDRGDQGTGFVEATKARSDREVHADMQ
jgi:hypothetical protein